MTTFFTAGDAEIVAGYTISSAAQCGQKGILLRLRMASECRKKYDNARRTSSKTENEESKSLPPRSRITSPSRLTFIGPQPLHHTLCTTRTSAPIAAPASASTSGATVPQLTEQGAKDRPRGCRRSTATSPGPTPKSSQPDSSKKTSDTVVTDPRVPKTKTFGIQTARDRRS